MRYAAFAFSVLTLFAPVAIAQADDDTGIVTDYGGGQSGHITHFELTCEGLILQIYLTEPGTTWDNRIEGWEESQTVVWVKWNDDYELLEWNLGGPPD